MPSESNAIPLTPPTVGWPNASDAGMATFPLAAWSASFVTLKIFVWVCALLLFSLRTMKRLPSLSKTRSPFAPVPSPLVSIVPLSDIFPLLGSKLQRRNCWAELRNPPK
ncbi:Uncharacterised protein [Mycobacteroides abscessus subsp. abscessus]|nr:Uncharacterised protein [Mycobacteroides abscessus subsp. abscessus]